MKQFFFILFIGCTFQALGQILTGPNLSPKTSTKIDSMNSLGRNLVNHWKWHSGDNASWSRPDFDDSQWESINLEEPIHKLPKLREAEIGWFRRKLSIGPKMLNKPLCITINQVGASEVYIDGKLLHKLGVVSKNPAIEQTENQVLGLPFSLSDTNQHVIAVRFSHTKSNFYYPGSTLPVFTMKLMETQYFGSWVKRQAQRKTGFLFFGIGIFLVFGILHFSFYASNRTKKVSLVLGITMFMLAISFLFLNFEASDVSNRQLYLLIFTVSFYIGILLINVSLYSYLNQPFRWIFYWQVLLMTASLICNIADINLPGELESWPPFVIIFIDFIRVSILADRRGDSNAKVPINSLLVVAVCFVLAIIILAIVGSQITMKSNGFDNMAYVTNLAIFIVIVMFFSIPIGLSLSLVREYTRTHKALSKKLEEIESLSAKNLAQEQEKQQILAAQNETLEKQVTKRTSELKQSLENLKETQAQLVQSEKLASLGELTAGIAHEIQNPLNFVNNFSELSLELIEELNEERNKEADKRDEGLEIEILGDISQNLEKINTHGKRASSIVRGMLEHSRASTGQKDPTDINALADEYLRLAYHGLRAKDKSFNADFKTYLAKDLPKIKIIPQDFGRVLLNLINNAFYAVNKRQGQENESGGDGEKYKGTVIVSTEKLEDSVEIKIKDNGTGIPENLKSKIFQPFFTTKPTGQGTGLGLSLAYDIVTKGHGGTLEVETKEGEGTTFIITLPLD